MEYCYFEKQPMAMGETERELTVVKRMYSKAREALGRGIAFLKDEQVEIRIRMLVLLQVSVLVAFFIGTTSMVILRQPLTAMLPNFLLLGLTLAGLYFSRRKNYTLASVLMIIGCADITLPVMYFMAGGSNSGMPIWLVFGVVVACMMSKGKTRIVMVLLTLVEDIVIMLVCFYRPELVTPMVGENTGFFDMVQSFAVVSVGLCILYIMHIMTYERQRAQLEYQRKELVRLMQTDELTGTFNRRAYYEDIASYQQGKVDETLVLVALDVNGLKQVNDNRGHAQGDLLLKSSADVIVRAFCKYGRVYRTGGDEFTALLHCSQEEADRLQERLNACIKLSDVSGPAAPSVAMGAVRWGENTKRTFQELEHRADELMYENKRLHYSEKGAQMI